MIPLTKYPSRAAWLKARVELGTIGASEVATVLGANPFDSLFALWSRRKGISPPVEETRQMRRGKNNESFIIGEYNLEVDRGLHGANAKHAKRIVNSLAWCEIEGVKFHASPDGFIEGEDIHVEAKDSLWYQAWAEGTPLHVQAQIQPQLMVLKTKACRALGMVGDTLNVEDFTLDERVIYEVIIPKCRAFQESLKGDEPPWGQIDASDATRSTLNALWKARRVEGKIEAVPELTGAVDALRAAEAQVKAFQEIIDEKKNAIRAAIAERKVDGVEAGGYIYEMRTVERKAFEVAASTSTQLKSRKTKGE